MASVQNIAIIDIGKTNAKVLLVDAKTLQEIALLTTPNQVVHAEPYPHFNVEHLWQFIIASLTELQDKHGIAAISITTHGACAALLKENGQLAAPIIDYEYQGIEDTAKRYDHIRPPFAETGSPRLPVGLNLGAQIYWQFETITGLQDYTKTIVMYPQYWAYKLTGITANEVTSLGCHTDLWNPSLNDYSSMLDALGWRDKFAPIRSANAVLGSVLPAIHEKTGLPASTPVYCGIHDSNASLYPYLLLHTAPFAVVSTGTWVIAMSVGGADTTLDEKRDTLINVNALGGKVPSARFMGGREFETICGKRGYEFATSHINSVLENGVMLLPSVENSSGPFVGRSMKWTHHPDTISDGENAVVASFYLALMTSICLDLTGARGQIFIEGNMARNQAFVSMLQAMVEGEVSISEGTGTSQGAALLVVGSLRQTKSQPIQPLHELADMMRSYGAKWKNELRNN